VGDPKERTFRVPWKHGSRHGWSVNDAALFQAWALYTGKYKEGRDIPDPRKWKTNFRCALNAVPDIKEIRGKSCPRGKDAFKIYRMARLFGGGGRCSYCSVAYCKENSIRNRARGTPWGQNGGSSIVSLLLFQFVLKPGIDLNSQTATDANFPTIDQFRDVTRSIRR